MSGGLKNRTRLRTFTEDQAVRRLQRGGMCIKSGGQWRLYRTCDKRGGAIGIVLAHVIERLEAQGDVRADRRQPKRRIWCGAEAAEPTVKALPTPHILKRDDTRKACHTALDAALKYEGDAASRIRLIAAARRYIADIEQAATPHSMTMQWGQSRIDTSMDITRYGGPGGRSQAGARRLKNVHDAVGADMQRALDRMLVREASLAAFERHMACEPGQGAAIAHGALVQLAEAYDLRVKAA